MSQVDKNCVLDNDDIGIKERLECALQENKFLRDRITKLEHENSTLSRKYLFALKRLGKAEKYK